MKKKIKYSSDMPRLLYTFFISHVDTASAPSFDKFARSIGATLADVERFREKEEFDRAWRECSEIRRDYLIDSALSKRMDASFTKFILTDIEGDKRTEEKIHFTLEVLEDENNEP